MYGVYKTYKMADEKGTSKVCPFSELRIASHHLLRNVDRQPCPKCKASRRYYCYTCHLLVGLDRTVIPAVKLPVPIHIVKNRLEVAGKSTATHACILAPDHAKQYEYPIVPEIFNKENTILVFPSDNAMSLQELGTQCREKNQNIENVVFIDGTWQQTNVIISDERLMNIQRVKLEKAKTHYWRPQKGKPDTCLATIEAIYYFFKEYHEHVLQRKYEGEYDNLLYFFVFQYNLVNENKRKRDQNSFLEKKLKKS